jgi:plasmid maintenance system killer protein
MRLVGFRHKGLRQLYTDDNPKGLSVSLVDKLRKLLFAMETAQDIEQVGRFPCWKLHPLKGGLERLLEPDRHCKLARDLPLRRDD